MSIEREVLLEILRDACRAPSADNTQPWRFIVESDTIRVINTGDQVESIFNYRQMANHVSLGACIENLCVSAEGHGFQVDLTLFPDPSNRLVVARVVLIQNVGVTNGLAPFIKHRASNRKKYHPKKIVPDVLAQFGVLADGVGGRMALISNEEDVKAMSHTISVGEKLALETKSIHDFLFEHVTWTKKEDGEKHGFLIDTFEFTPPQRAAFKLFSNWNILKFFLPLGIADFIAHDMEKVHATAAVFGAIIMPGKEDEDYLKTGILFERLWLAATKLDLSLHPTSGLNFFAMPILEGNYFGLRASAVELLTNRYRELAEQFGVAIGETVTIAFRLGHADPPSAVTTRFEPNVTWL